jgi:lysine 2,3-aminomutase
MIRNSGEQTSEPPLSVRNIFFPGVPDEKWDDWRWQFRNRITSLQQLTNFIPAPEEHLPALQQVIRNFRLGITPYYLSLIDPSNSFDPIARQALPALEELLYQNMEDDPLHEEDSSVPGLTHRYPDRVLLVVTDTCAMYCRHCTRKRIMADGAPRHIKLDQMIRYIAAHPDIRDVIISGGDPLMLPTSRLENVLARIRAIPHVEIIRIGSRIPCVLPQRINAELCEMLEEYHPLWINVQFNHPRECTDTAMRACDLLLRAGIPLNNQSVLLRGVNDDIETMRALIHGLLRMRVRPYYLFQCDPVRGSGHFRTTIARGLMLLEQLRGHTSGLSIPTYVIDLPGGGGKVPVGPMFMMHYDERAGRAILRNFQGRVFEYFDPECDPPSVAPNSGPAVWLDHSIRKDV